MSLIIKQSLSFSWKAFLILFLRAFFCLGNVSVSLKATWHKMSCFETNKALWFVRKCGSSDSVSVSVKSLTLLKPFINSRTLTLPWSKRKMSCWGVARRKLKEAAGVEFKRNCSSYVWNYKPLLTLIWVTVIFQTYRRVFSPQKNLIFKNIFDS